MTKAPAITDANFESTLQDHPLVLVDFWATWCPPSQKLGPIIDELANDYAGRIMIGKLDVDKNPGVTTKYGIKSIPALLVFALKSPANITTFLLGILSISFSNVS